MKVFEQRATHCRLGIDIGRVIISGAGDDNRDTSFLRARGETVVATPPAIGLFETLPRLVEHFDGEVWLISKARPPMQAKTDLWLEHHRFFERTGVLRSHLRYCLERSEKTMHCRDLGITHFIDDRLDVLLDLDGVARRRYLFGQQKAGLVIPSRIIRLRTWHDARISAFA